MPNASLTIDGTEVIKKENGSISVTANDINLYNGSLLTTIPTFDGSTSDLAAPSAKFLRDYCGITTTGTYWIRDLEGHTQQIYCDMDTSGGGWMSFASAPASGNWFGGNINANWEGLSYSYGTYSSTGAIGNYWRNYVNQDVSEILFKTGNGTYWIHILLNEINYNTSYSYLTPQATSNNFPDQTCQPNTNVTVLYRTSSNGEDPWINAGASHACGGNYMFWGENNTTSHVTFKNANGGIMVFVR